MISRVAMSIWRQQFCRFSASNRRNNWTDESFRKLWLTTARARPQGAAVSSPPHRRLRESRKRRQSKLQNISNRERGGNRFKSRASARQSISTKVTAPLLRMSQQLTDYSATAERIASIGASRLNQTENERAP